MKKYTTKTRQEKNKEYLAAKDYDRLIINNKPFILALAKTFNQTLSKQQDLVQEGEIAIWIAATTFDETKGNFLAYAKLLIINKMKDYLTKYGNTVRTPINVIRDKDTQPKITISLNNPVGDDGAILEDFIASEVSEEGFDLSFVKTVLNDLKPKQREIIEMYFGLVPGTEPLIQAEIAQYYGTSKQNINQQINKVLKKLENDKRLHSAYKSATQTN